MQQQVFPTLRITDSARSKRFPRDEPWGNRDMRIVDPDGNQLCVCTPIRRQS